MIAVFLLALSLSTASTRVENNANAVRDLQAKADHAFSVGNYDDARKYFVQELNLLVAKGEQARAGDVYIQLGEMNQIHGAFSTAESNYKSGLDLLKRYARPSDLRLVGAWDDLGWLYITWGRFLEGSRLLDLAQAKAEAAPPKDPNLIRHLDTQAAYQTVIGRYSEARRDWNRALEIGKSNYGPDGLQYANIFVHLGQASALNGDYDVALEMLRRYIEMERRGSSVATTERAVAAAELGHVYAQLHKFSQARPWFDDAIGIFNSNSGQAPLVHSMVLSYLGDYYMAQNDWRNAELQYREALSIQQKVLGDNRAVAVSMMALAQALKKLHFKDEAKDLTARAKAIIAADQNPPVNQTVDVTALRRQ